MTAETNIRIEAASPDDAPALAAIWHLGWIDGHAATVSEDLVAVRTADEFLRRMTARIAEVRVARHAGEIAGFHIVVDDELEQIYVSADHRGAGIAQHLLASAEQQIATNGHTRAWLAVVAGNDRAQAFYRKQGWQDEGLFDYEAAGPDGPINVPSHRYVKTLDRNNLTP